ncbi:MAG TPA: hypothetical protein VJH22_02270 [Candidatus Nanoarchaeia archaeon]|nr:hypothetical protein [Candidatus Nanoarchaeia archaeon]
MQLRDAFRYEPVKLVWSFWLFGMVYFTTYRPELVNGLFYILLTLLSAQRQYFSSNLWTTVSWFITFADLVVNVILYFVATSFAMHAYRRFVKSRPGLKEFFEWQPIKGKIIGLIAGIYLIIGIILTVFWNLPYPKMMLLLPLHIISMALSLSEIPLLVQAYWWSGMSTSSLSLLPSLMIAILWWYILASLISWWMERKKGRNKG